MSSTYDWRWCIRAAARLPSITPTTVASRRRPRWTMANGAQGANDEHSRDLAGLSVGAPEPRDGGRTDDVLSVRQAGRLVVPRRPVRRGHPARSAPDGRRGQHPRLLRLERTTG